ncbi:MAG TPA: hypothetical protein VH349_09710 [Ktedonobacterales bacterium]|jgi:hypothetical protein
MRLSEKYSFTRAWLGLGYFVLLVFTGYLIYFALTPVVPPARNVFSAETLPFIWPHIWGFLAVAIPFILWLSVGSFYVFPLLRRQMRLHKAYLMGKPTALIQPQPISRDLEIQELWIRSTRPRRFSQLFVLLLVFPVALPWLISDSFPHEPVRSIVGIIVLICEVLALLVVLVLPGSLFAASPSLRADSQGFTVNNLPSNKETTMKWQDARIFARVGSYRRNPRLAYYELVDDKQLLTFVVALKPPARFALVKPTTAFEEYERQTQQLLGMIAAETGLPLVDLRSR